MNLRLPLRLGLRTLVGTRGRLSPHLLGAVLGIGLSLVPLIVVLEVADGMIEGITRRYLEVGSYHFQVVAAEEVRLEALQELAVQLEGLPGVLRVIPERQGLGLLAGPRGRTAVTVRAVDPSLYERDEGFRKYFSLKRGTFDLSSPNSILLGQEVADRLGVSVGEKVKLLTASSSRSLPRVTTLTVTGVFSTGYQELDKLWTYVSLQPGANLLPRGSSSTFLGIKVRDPFADLNGQVRRLEAALPAGAQVYSWFALERANYKSFQTTKALLLFIMALIVVVATVNISSALVMVVLERLQEIGILKAMGAHPRELSLAFLFTGLLTGLAGTLLGLGLGILISVNVNALIRALEAAVNLLAWTGRALLSPFGWLQDAGTPVRIFNPDYYLEWIPIRLRLGQLLMVVICTLLLSTFSAYFPARATGRIRPLEVLRKY